MASRARKSASTLDAQQGTEQMLRGQLAAADIVNGELLDRVIRLEDALKQKEHKLRSAYDFGRKYRNQLIALGAITPEARPVDDALAARRAAMATAKAEAIATGTSVKV